MSGAVSFGHFDYRQARRYYEDFSNSRTNQALSVKPVVRQKFWPTLESTIHGEAA
jgi:hypothetical protein